MLSKGNPMTKEKYTFLNVRFDQEIIDLLDALVAEDTQLIGVKMDRSKTVKRLIRQEIARREQTGVIVTELPCPDGGQAPILIGTIQK
jgi:hypothetical protein